MSTPTPTPSERGCGCGPREKWLQDRGLGIVARAIRAATRAAGIRASDDTAGDGKG